MKKTFAILTLAVVTAFSAFTPNKTEKFVVQTDKSKIEWLGKKVTGQHAGTVNVKDGSLIFNGSKLTGGQFNIDMTSIADVDGSARLIGHLKSPDFFDVEKHAVSTFVITNVTPNGQDNVNITGNLTIKGISNPLTFPATVKRSGGVVVATANGIKVDRTKYDIKYGSKTFFGSIGDKAIDDEFTLTISLLAKK